MRIAYHPARASMACAREAQVFAGRLACDGAAGFENSRHHGRIEFWNVTFEQSRTVHHRNTGDAYVVLDRDLFAGQEPFRAGADLSLPVPSAIRTFGCRRTISWRARCDRPQIRRDQFFEPAI